MTCMTCRHFGSAGRDLNKSRGGKEEMKERAGNIKPGAVFFWMLARTVHVIRDVSCDVQGMTLGCLSSCIDVADNDNTVTVVRHIRRLGMSDPVL